MGHLELRDVLSAMVAIIGAMLMLFVRGFDGRLKALETSAEDKATAEEQRLAIKKIIEDHAYRDEKQYTLIETSLRDFRIENRDALTAIKLETAVKRDEARADLSHARAEINSRVETVRVETNTRLDTTNAKLDGVVNQIGALALLQIRENGHGPVRKKA